MEGEAFSDGEAPFENSNHHEVFGALVLFQDFVRHSPQSASHITCAEEASGHWGYYVPFLRRDARVGEMV
jgi:hypothetical protein